MNPSPKVVICHHTATSARAAGDYPSLSVVRDGRPGLSGPLSHYGIGRNGTVYVIASGKANHAGVGTWGGTTRSIDCIGIEAESPGDGTWTAAQLDTYDRLAAAILAHLKLDVSALCAHREWARPPGRKPDPTGIDMVKMRARVAQLLRPMVRVQAEDEDVRDEDIARIADEVWGRVQTRNDGIVDYPNVPGNVLFATLRAIHVLTARVQALEARISPPEDRKTA